MAVISPIHSAGGTKVNDCDACEQKAVLTRTHVDVCAAAEIAHNLLIRSKAKVCQAGLVVIVDKYICLGIRIYEDTSYVDW